MIKILRSNLPYSLLSRNFGFTFATELPPRQTMEYDVVIVGGGVAGLATAIKLKQKQQQHDRPINVCLIEKGGEIGDHVLSGNCFEPRAFTELFPDWKTMKDNPPPINTPVTSDNFYILTSDKHAVKVPHFMYPKTLRNEGNYITSLSQLSRWMGQKAQQMGVDIFSGTPGSQILYDQDGSVKGVATGDFGISKKGEMKQNFQRGIEILAKQTVFAEGARGSLSQKVMEKFNLRQNADPQLYGIGLKEVWEVEPGHKLHNPGYVQHTVGWPLDTKTYAGSFMYHMAPNYIHIGVVVGLNYQNPYLNPYEQFQRFKTHPQIRKYLEGGQCISYGARALNSGGYFSVPKLTFPGGVIVGCSAGFMNVLKIKGSHTAIKSGIQAGKTIYDKLIMPPTSVQKSPKIVQKYQSNMQNSWVWKELYAARNIKNVFKHGLFPGLAYGGLYAFLNGKQPIDYRNKSTDSEQTKTAENFSPIEYPKHDRKLTFDLLDNLARSGTNHDHDQPSHLVVKPGKEDKPLESLKRYAAPQERFCPAKVYEFVDDAENGGKKLQINAQNCLHCKTCSIKMIDEYIDWRTPQGRGGPKYNLM